jgi:hypothetical protein
LAHASKALKRSSGLTVCGIWSVSVMVYPV